MVATFGEGKIFLKIAKSTFLRYEITLSRTVKEIEANLKILIT